MDIETQARFLAEENQRLRDSLAKEQNARRKWQGALNRAEDIIKRELRRVSANYDDSVQREDTISMTLDSREYNALSTAIDAIQQAEKEARQKNS